MTHAKVTQGHPQCHLSINHHDFLSEMVDRKSKLHFFKNKKIAEMSPRSLAMEQFMSGNFLLVVRDSRASILHRY